MSEMLMAPVLSARQVQPLLAARRQGQERATTSLDLGISTGEVRLTGEGAVLPGGQRLGWASIEAIAGAESSCFEIEGNEAVKIQRYSETTGRFCSLMPTSGAPTLLVAGFPMHRIKDIDPHRDTLLKIRTLAPVRGEVLDTCTGLGYTAIEAARAAQRVLTVELDSAVLEIARKNPWSRRLFDDARIEQVAGDVSEVIEALADGRFDRILHDPPTVSLAGELYSGAFYGELYRVLSRRGRLYHYIGDPESRLGRNTTRGVVRRLQEAGFTRIVRRPEAFGVVAYRSG